MRKQFWCVGMRNLGCNQMVAQASLSTCIIIDDVPSGPSSMSRHCSEAGLGPRSTHVVAAAAANRRVVEGSTGISGKLSDSRRPRPFALVSSCSALGYLFIP